jgi:hypothetical protein
MKAIKLRYLNGRRAEALYRMAFGQNGENRCIYWDKPLMKTVDPEGVKSALSLIPKEFAAYIEDVYDGILPDSLKQILVETEGPEDAAALMEEPLEEVVNLVMGEKGFEPLGVEYIAECLKTRPKHELADQTETPAVDMYTWRMAEKGMASDRGHDDTRLICIKATDSLKKTSMWMAGFNAYKDSEGQVRSRPTTEFKVRLGGDRDLKREKLFTFAGNIIPIALSNLDSLKTKISPTNYIRFTRDNEHSAKVLGVSL